MRQTVVSVPGPSQLCFYTDGVTEARGGSELYGSERLANGLLALGSDTTAATLLDHVAAEADARPDDMAACLLRVEGGSGAPGILFEELELDRDEPTTERAEQFLLASGVQPDELAEVMRSARISALRGNAAVIELRFSAGAPSVSVRHETAVRPAALVAASGL
jgi:hypothetical protein